MKNGSPVYKTIDGYIALQEPADRTVLEYIRKTIRKAAPKAEELISYGMPAFSYFGALVYIAAMKNHFGFYPTSSPMKYFAPRLKPYFCTKGAIQFPKDEPVPLKLIADIVKYRVKENEQRRLKKKTGNK
jgi:uncharacterized protein YdhG (YjbR/CyaY superfamily)